LAWRRFARASFERLFIVQAVFALCASLSVVWPCPTAFSRPWSHHRESPRHGQHPRGQLDWRDDSPLLLAEGSILAISVGLGTRRVIAFTRRIFQFEFLVVIPSCVLALWRGGMDYPHDYTIAANVGDAPAGRGAWAPDVLALVAIGTFIGLLAIWGLMATIYCLPCGWFVFLPPRPEPVLPVGGWRQRG